MHLSIAAIAAALGSPDKQQQDILDRQVRSPLTMTIDARTRPLLIFIKTTRVLSNSSRRYAEIIGAVRRIHAASTC